MNEHIKNNNDRHAKVLYCVLWVCEQLKEDENVSQVQIERAGMQRDEQDHFIGYAIFTYEGHTAPYEITFHSKDGRDWDYSLNFADEPGLEEQFLTVDELIEQSDDLFDDLLDAAIEAGNL